MAKNLYALQEKLAKSMHERLLKIMKPLPSDFAPYGERDRDEDFGDDCSCGCKFFLVFPQAPDWGVCTNPKSPRCSLLTFEHQGCRDFEYEEEAQNDCPGAQ